MLKACNAHVLLQLATLQQGYIKHQVLSTETVPNTWGAQQDLTNFQVAVISQTGASETQGWHQEGCALRQLPDLDHRHALGYERISPGAGY